MNAKFNNPFDGTPDSELLRTTIVVDRRDWAFISGLHGRKSSGQNTLYILLTRLIEQLKSHGINEYNPEQYESAVAGCRVTLDAAIGNRPRGTTPDDKPEPKAPRRNDRRRASRVVQPSEGSVD